MCKSDNDAVILSMDRDLRYEDLDLRKLNVSERGSLYFLDREVESRFKRLLEINCPVPGCGKQFSTQVQYKNHLKREHKRYVW